MNGQVVAWDDPPTLDGLTGHAGALPNCRCIPLPIIPEDLGVSREEQGLTEEQMQQMDGLAPEAENAPEVIDVPVLEPEVEELKYSYALDPVDMPVQRGEPIEIDKAKEGTNPDFSKGFQYEYNCQRCVPAYELRRRGYDVESMPVDLKKLRGKNMDRLAVVPQAIFVDENGMELKPNQLFTTAEGQELKKKLRDELLKTAGDARFEIKILWKSKNGHVLVAEKQGDEILFIDPQDASKKDIDWTKVRQNGVSYWRMDNAKFNPNIPISEVIKESRK
jgi:hypothetical protein